MKPSQFRTTIFLLIAISTFLLPLQSLAHPAGQVPTPESRAAALLEQMSIEERIGQLFLVDFEGATINEDDPIYDLIVDYHIGGVVLRTENNNFTGPDDTLQSALLLTQNIQSTAFQASQLDQVSTTGQNYSPAFIPLMIAIQQDNLENAPNQILNGLTPLPNPMAIGATWNTENAFLVGEIIGDELESLGINMFLGPSLNVLETPHPESSGDINILSFGGNPYWVGQMGQSFIEGIHVGSENRIAVIPTNFPGLTGTDQPIGQEIPAILSGLDELIQVEMAPFFYITGNAASPAATADGLLIVHAKYQGLQDAIRPTTPPISLDSRGMETLFTIPEFASWREQGGLVISDQLGTSAIRRFYDPEEEIFNARIVALDAFQAGNDILILGDFVSNQDQDALATVTNTLDFFVQKYLDDPIFAARVDAAVLRILAKKFSIYDTFTLDNVLTDPNGLQFIGNQEQVTLEIAQQAATLFSPSSADLHTILPSAPILRENIVIITDSVSIRDCDTCPSRDSVQVNALEQAINRLYGPEAGGLISQLRISSYSFLDLLEALDSDDENNALFGAIRSAEWVIFLPQDQNPDREESIALNRFLTERQDLINTPQKRVLVFSLNAPYFLRATNISSITAYYGLFSSQPQFIEICARILFHELSSPGASPVSVEGIGYDLSTILAPNPDYQYPLNIFSASDFPLNNDSDEDGEITPPPSEFQVGDSIVLQAGPILDLNGNPIPAGTFVRFILNTDVIDGQSNQREISTTSQAGGYAIIPHILENGGSLSIQAFSGLSNAASDQLLIQVIGTNQSTPSPPQVTEIPEEDAAAASNGEDEIETPEIIDYLSLGGWLLAIAVNIFFSLFAYQAGATSGQIRWGARWALMSFIGGLTATNYLAFRLPGAQLLIRNYQIWGIVILSAMGTLLGWAIGVFWSRIRK